MITGLGGFANYGTQARNSFGKFGNFSFMNKAGHGNNGQGNRVDDAESTDSAAAASAVDSVEVEEQEPAANAVEEVEAQEESVLSEEEQKAAALDELLKKYGVDLSSDSLSGNNFGMQYVKSQFEINYSVMQSINTANGVETRSFEFSFSASMESLQIGSGNFASDPFSWMENIPGFSGTGEAGQADESSDVMSPLMDFFSPEATANRILDFALGGFGNSSYAAGGDTEESRSGFAQFIGEAIQKGFDEAMGILGEVDDSIQSDIDKTHNIVFDGLDDFVSGDVDAGENDNSALMASMQQYSFQFSASYQQTQIWYQNADASEAGAAQDGSSAVNSVA